MQINDLQSGCHKLDPCSAYHLEPLDFFGFPGVFLFHRTSVFTAWVVNVPLPIMSIQVYTRARICR